MCQNRISLWSHNKYEQLLSDQCLKQHLISRILLKPNILCYMKKKRHILLDLRSPTDFKITLCVNHIHNVSLYKGTGVLRTTKFKRLKKQLQKKRGHKHAININTQAYSREHGCKLSVWTVSTLEMREKLMRCAVNERSTCSGYLKLKWSQGKPKQTKRNFF